MAKVSIYFRNEKKDYEILNMSFDPDLYVYSTQIELIKLGCSFQIFGNSFFCKSIERFVSDSRIKVFSYLISAERKCYYVIRREED